MHKADSLKESNRKSLEQLETDSTDIFYLHAPDRSVPFQETLKAINDLYKEGKFTTFALSNFTAAEVDLFIDRSEPADHVRNIYCRLLRSV
jgi:aflatoxin B1 aldehyde reductase